MATLNIVDLCFQMNIHCTVFGTGLIYTYDENHPLGSGIGFTVSIMRLLYIKKLMCYYYRKMINLIMINYIT